MKVKRGRERARAREKKTRTSTGSENMFSGRTKLLKDCKTLQPSLLLDALYLSLCIELAYDGTKELLVAVLGIACLGGQLLVQ